MMPNTIQQFDEVTKKCAELFLNKTTDYGTAWRILRTESLTDQIFIKAQRIRSIEEKGGTMLVNDPVENEFVGIINYCLIALMQLKLNTNDPLDLPIQSVLIAYNAELNTIKNLLAIKNHDYGEAWRDMRISSFTDLILMKLLRIKQIEDNKGKTIASEGVEAGYQDIVNYAVFALIKIG